MRSPKARARCCTRARRYTRTLRCRASAYGTNSSMDSAKRWDVRGGHPVTRTADLGCCCCNARDCLLNEDGVARCLLSQLSPAAATVTAPCGPPSTRTPTSATRAVSVSFAAARTPTASSRRTGGGHSQGQREVRRRGGPREVCADADERIVLRERHPLQSVS